MIPEKYIDAYRSIGAPETLRERVVNKAARGRRRARITAPRIIAAAASIAVVIAAAALLLPRGGGASLVYDGAEVKNVTIERPVIGKIALFDADQTPVGVQFTLTAADDVIVSVIGGSAEIRSRDGAEIGYADDAASASIAYDVIPEDGAELYWCMAGEVSTLSIKNAGGKIVAEYVMTDIGGAVTVEKK